MFEATMLLIFITAIDVVHIKTHLTVFIRHSSLNTIFKHQKKRIKIITFIETAWLARGSTL